jgi:hypothetical protein
MEPLLILYLVYLFLAFTLVSNIIDKYGFIGLVWILVGLAILDIIFGGNSNHNNSGSNDSGGGVFDLFDNENDYCSSVDNSSCDFDSWDDDGD